jgi:hypothetical protein
MKRFTDTWRRFLAQPPPRRLLALEALAWLLAARLAARCCPSRRIAAWASRAPHRAPPDAAARERLDADVAWAVEAVAARLPGTVCLPRALAAQAMLRRRGVATTLYFGALRVPAGALGGHVWLQDGARGIVGHQAARDCHVLAAYPAEAGA